MRGRNTRALRMGVVAALALATMGLGIRPAAASHNDLFANAQRITGSISHTNVGAGPNEPGETAPCAGSAASVWYRYTPASTGSLTVTTFGTALDTTLHAYRSASSGTTRRTLSSIVLLACNDDFGGLQSSITFGVTGNQTIFIKVAGFGGLTGSFPLNISGPAAGAPPANDDFAAAGAIGVPGSLSSSNAGAGVETLEPTPCSSFQTTVWYNLTAPATAPVRVDTVGSAVDTVLAVYTGGSVGGLTTIGCDDDSAGNFDSRVTFNATAGTTYRIAVGGFGSVGGAVGAFNLNTATIPTAPQNLTAAPGTSVGQIALSWQAPASNGGSALTTYQIYRDGVLIISVPAGQTTHTDGGLNLLQSYTYVVRATNAVGQGPSSNSACNKPFPWVGQLDCII